MGDGNALFVQFFMWEKMHFTREKTQKKSCRGGFEILSTFVPRAWGLCQICHVF